MPTYVYKCAENEHITEVKQRFTDPPMAECPECGSEVRKLINSVGIVFKGKGFYVTDNRGKNSAAPGKDGGDDGSGSKSKGSESASASESSNGGESKSAPKKETSADAKPAKKSAETVKS